MSKYYKAEDVIRWINAELKFQDLPTIEVSEDCISKAYLEQEIENQIMPAIDREMYWQGWNNALCKVVELIEDAPSVVPSRAEGEWQVRFPYDDNGKVRMCSNCYVTQSVNVYEGKVRFRFCPYCGAKMHLE